MQKQFLWRRQLKDDPSRHKFTPSLIFTPKNAGGLGLIAIPVAIQAQRVKVSMLWLLSKKDIYCEAWFAWMGFHDEEPAVTPRRNSKGRCPAAWSDRRRLFQMEVCTELAPTEAEQHERQKLAAVFVPRLAAVAGKNPRSATYQPRSREPIIVEVDLNDIPPRQLESPELKAFWGTFTWADNPWIPDSNVPVLLRTKYDQIAVTSVTSLEIIRTARSTYSVRVPTAPGFQEGHTIAKLERWLIAILLHSPRIQVGEQLGRAPPLQLRKPPQLTPRFSWTAEGDAIVVGTSEAGNSTIKLQQQVNGLNWDVVAQENAEKDVKKLTKHPGGIVFHANPRIHGYPWQAPERTRNRNILKELKTRPKKQLRLQASPGLEKVLMKWEARAGSDEWIRGLQSQLPQQLWSNRNTLTNYQVWVTYRLAAQQLNLHYEGEQPKDGCLLAQDEIGAKVTITHITWGCERAQQFWSRCVEHWLGHEVSSSRLEAYKHNISAREAPPVSDRMRRGLTKRYGHWNNEYEEALRRIWWSVCSIGYAPLWQIRNQVVHAGKEWRAPQQLEYMWASCLRQLSAVARSERNRPATRITGLRLQLTLDCFVAIGIEAEPPDSPPAPASWLKKTESALLKRLRTYQEAIN
ncbi:hypothetical protein PF006_g5001 [Phytophthora fragariae]|nr:hypothetical protein PF006_g5001 [Phytophthora fragariae]